MKIKTLLTIIMLVAAFVQVGRAQTYTQIAHVTESGVVMDISQSTAVTAFADQLNDGTVFTSADVKWDATDGCYILSVYDGYNSTYSSRSGYVDLWDDGTGALYVTRRSDSKYRMCSGFNCQCRFTPVCSCAGGGGGVGASCHESDGGLVPGHLGNL